MALDMFIVFNAGSDIKGDTKDTEYASKKGIEILAWSWGASQSGTMHSSGGGGAGRANIQDLSFTKYLDTASVGLTKAIVSGQHIDDVILAVRKAGTTQQKYYEITMTKVLVSSLSTGGSGGEDRLTENVTLNFESLKVEYFAQDDTGAVASQGTITYNAAEHSWA